MVKANKYTEFGPEGFLIARNNPDGTPASPLRILGFYGTVDMTAYGTHAYIGIKKDSGTEEIKLIDWSSALDNTAVTVDEMATAFNTAGFTDIIATQDLYTERLHLYYSGTESINFLQVFSVESDPGFAAALDIGNGQKFGGFGIIYYPAFDNTITFTFPKNIKDKEEIETESGDGTLISVIIQAIMKGYTPVITTTDNDYKIKQLIQGGTWEPDISKYTPPLSSQTEKPIFSVHFFSPLYGKGSNDRSNEIGYLRRVISSMTGVEGDESFEAKALKQTLYNCDATEWTDETGTRQPFYYDQNISPEEFDALDVENIEPDRSNET